MSVTLYDDFANTLGEFPDYDTYDSSQRTQLARQKHVDLRSFQQNAITFGYSMFALDRLLMSNLDALTMGQLDGGNVLVAGENWSDGTVGPQADRNQFLGIQLSCAAGNPKSTQSVMAPIDISAFTTGDYISLALPAFPLASLTPPQCFLDLTSESSGNFAAGPTDSLPFSGSITTLTTGDCEARFPLSQLTHVDLRSITGIRFRILATANCTFRCLAIRCIATTWEYAPLDLNTLYDRIQATVPPTASLSQSYAFPSASAPLPSGMPILLRSDGEDGPLVVDIEQGIIIHAGQGNQANSLTLYFREFPMIPRTMTTMDTLTMGQIEALGGQPDYTPAQLDNYTATKYLSVKIAWGTTNSVVIGDDTGAVYTFSSSALTSGQDYYVLATLYDHALRVQIHPCSSNATIDWGTVVFDSTTVIDDGFIRRRRGRVGWQAQLGEGDTYLRTLRPRRAVYSEYRSAPLRSVTPVEGAQLFVSATASANLYPGATAMPGTVISPDVTKSRSGKCIKVQCDGHVPIEGLIADPMRFEDFYDASVEFDVLASLATQLTAVLIGEGRIVSLYLPPFPTNRWTNMSLPLDSLGPQVIPGLYALYLVQTQTGQNTWYVDHFTVNAQAVAWAGRGHAADPWGMNNPAWIHFGSRINDPYNGALLGRGTALQVRGQTLTADAEISSVTILPRYSTLGNFVWHDEAPAYPSAPVASFTFSSSGLPAPHTLSVDGTASTAAAGVAYYYWTFGDGGYGYGSQVSHTYTLGGTYTVSLTVVDQVKQQTTVTHVVNV